MIELSGITWNHTRGFDPLVAAAAEFSRGSSEVRIHWRKRSLHEFGHTPVDQLARDYDLVVLDHPWVGCMAESGDYLPLNAWLGPERLDELAQHSAGPSHPSYEWEGEQWALAIDAATPSSSYRPDLLAQLGHAVPTTWDDVSRFGHQCLKSGLKIAIPLGPVDAITAFLSLAANLGPTPFSSSQCVVDHGTGHRVLSTLQGLLPFCPQDVFELTPITTMERMSTSDNIAYCPLAYSYSNYSRPGYRRHLCLYANLPGFDDFGPRGSHIGGTGLAISSRCRHPEVAAEFSYLVASGDWQRTLYFDAGGQPAHTAAWEDPLVNAACHDFFRNTRQTIEEAFLRPRHHGYIDFQYRGGELITHCLRTQGDHSQLLRDLDSLYRQSSRAAA